MSSRVSAFVGKLTIGEVVGQDKVRKIRVMPHLSESVRKENVDTEIQGCVDKGKQRNVATLSITTMSRDFGDPGPYGLLCFGMTTWTSWSESTFLPTVFCYALFYGGFGQIVAGVLELILGGNSFGGTAFASYGAFWMRWFLLEYLPLADSSFLSDARTGKTLWCGLWSFLTAGFRVFIVTLRKNGCLMTVFSSLVVTFALLAAGVHNKRCELAAGYLGFFCGSSAIYAAFAFLFKTELGVVLPGVEPVQFI